MTKMKQINVFNKVIYIYETNGCYSFYEEDVSSNESLSSEEYIFILSKKIEKKNLVFL